jgi:hypothetical protein
MPRVASRLIVVSEEPETDSGDRPERDAGDGAREPVPLQNTR